MTTLRFHQAHRLASPVFVNGHGNAAPMKLLVWPASDEAGSKRLEVAYHQYFVTRSQEAADIVT